MALPFQILVSVAEVQEELGAVELLLTGQVVAAEAVITLILEVEAEALPERFQMDLMAVM
jgi:hypothetical protein